MTSHQKKTKNTYEVGTRGSWRVTDPAEGTRLLEMANVLWNAVFTSSRVKDVGSPAEVDQVIVV